MPRDLVESKGSEKKVNNPLSLLLKKSLARHFTHPQGVALCLNC
jgi:hypothetical protein